MDLIIYLLEIGGVKMKAELMNAGIIRAVLSRIQLEEVPYDIALRCMLILRNLTKGDPHCSKTMSKF
jgi:hypothetical protein